MKPLSYITTLIILTSLLYTGCATTNILTIEIETPPTLYDKIPHEPMLTVNHCYNNNNNPTIGYYTAADQKTTYFNIQHQENPGDLIFPVEIKISNTSNEIQKLDSAQIIELNNQYGFHPILSFDGYELNYAVKESRLHDFNFMHYQFEIIISSHFSLYKRGDLFCSDVIELKDTFVYNSVAENINIALAQSTESPAIIPLSAQSAGENHQKRFFPNIQQTERYYYRNSANPIMHDAFISAKKGNWEDALYLWEYVLEQPEKPIVKALAAANTALCYELQDDYNNALRMIEEAIKLMPATNQRIEELKKYQQQLQDRLTNRSKLK